MPEITLPATLGNLETVLRFVEEQLRQIGIDKKTRMLAALAAEEIYVNIVHYAYAGTEGDAGICCEQSDSPRGATLCFTDSGKSFNPLENVDPDITLPAGQRQIGGLGVYLAKNVSQGQKYEYKDGKNRLTLIFRS